MSKPKRTPNYNAWQFVDKREEFIGSNLRGETYEAGSAPFAIGSWLSDYEMEMYEKFRPRITYIVWSYWTPIAYYVEGSGGIEGQWYKVAQSFSSCTSRHRSGALRNVVGHMVVLRERRGHNAVTCFDCGSERVFTLVNEARTAMWLHR